jgi:hypothetical protein
MVRGRSGRAVAARERKSFCDIAAYTQVRGRGGRRGEKLAEHVRPILLRRFTLSLNEQLAQWTMREVPNLYAPWMEANRKREDRESSARGRRANAGTPKLRRAKQLPERRVQLPRSMREAVVQHDTTEVAQRLERGAAFECQSRHDLLRDVRETVDIGPGRRDEEPVVSGHVLLGNEAFELEDDRVEWILAIEHEPGFIPVEEHEVRWLMAGQYGNGRDHRA